jgi:NADH dehydrogenase FAD-containing subunit
LATKSPRFLLYVICYIPSHRQLLFIAYCFHWQTAQVASQEGKYLGRKLSKLAKQEPILKQNDISATDEAVSSPFEYKHLGSLAYIGNAAVFDLGQNYSFMGGLVRFQ